jgi:hypothetical protein
MDRLASSLEFETTEVAEGTDGCGRKLFLQPL